MEWSIEATKHTPQQIQQITWWTISFLSLRSLFSTRFNWIIPRKISVKRTISKFVCLPGRSFQSMLMFVCLADTFRWTHVFTDACRGKLVFINACRCTIVFVFACWDTHVLEDVSQGPRLCIGLPKHTCVCRGRARHPYVCWSLPILTCL